MTDKRCTIDGCERAHIARGWCTTHYMRWRMHGDPNAGAIRTLAERFEAQVDRSGPISEHRPDLGRCHTWTGRVDRLGYGRTTHDNKEVGAHQVAYMLAYGPIPEGLEPDHLCRNRRCVNAAHMEAVTHRVNTLRGDSPSARCARQTHCVHGHPFDDENTRRRSSGRRDCRACERERQKGRTRRQVTHA